MSCKQQTKQKVESRTENGTVEENIKTARIQKNSNMPERTFLMYTMKTHVKYDTKTTTRKNLLIRHHF